MKSRYKIIIGIVILVALYIGYVAIPRTTPDKIVQLPDSHLREISEEVTVFNDEVRQISNELHEVLKEVDIYGSIFGLGMAAPQLGYNQRIIAIKESYGNYKTMVNPEIIEKKWQLPWLEGCFSLDGMHFTKRYFWTKVRYQDIDGNYHEERAPKIVQQEIDHINGVLITDY
jgi:peptide deformylase